jgi:hypothetical protein
MIVELEWLRAFELNDVRESGLIYDCEREEIPEDSGIYIFGRKHGNAFEALYVGKAGNLRRRLKSQFNNLRLMRHVEEAKTGDRLLLLGIYRPAGRTNLKKSLKIIETELIRYFLEAAHDIVNIHGARIKIHEIRSNGSASQYGIPRRIIVDADRY